MPKFKRRKKTIQHRVPPQPPLEFPVGSAEYVQMKNLESRKAKLARQIDAAKKSNEEKVE